MKEIIYGISLAAISLITIAIVMTMGGRTARTNELESNLSHVVEESVQNALIKKTYNINTREEFIADVTQNIMLQINSDAKITIDIISADLEKGLLSIRVSEEYKHPNGKTGKIECSRTVLLEQYEKEKLQVFEINYYVEGAVYKIYSITEKEHMILPKVPEVEGKTFSHWVNRDTRETVTKDSIVTGNSIVDAIFN